MTIGLLALQGGYEAHRAILEALGTEAVLVREARALDAVDALIIPGGESTVLSRLCERYGLSEPLRARLHQGMPLLATCAGLILAAREVENVSSNFAQSGLNVLDVTVARNAFGRQSESFEALVPTSIPGLDSPLRALFIRAPRIVRTGPGVQTLASWHGEPVLVRQGSIVAASFHPEVAGESRVHEFWLRECVAKPHAA